MLHYDTELATQVVREALPTHDIADVTAKQFRA